MCVKILAFKSLHLVWVTLVDRISFLAQLIFIVIYWKLIFEIQIHIFWKKLYSLTSLLSRWIFNNPWLDNLSLSFSPLIFSSLYLFEINSLFWKILYFPTSLLSPCIFYNSWLKNLFLLNFFHLCLCFRKP